MLSLYHFPSSRSAGDKAITPGTVGRLRELGAMARNLEVENVATKGKLPRRLKIRHEASYFRRSTGFGRRTGEPEAQQIRVGFVGLYWSSNQVQHGM